MMKAVTSWALGDSSEIVSRGPVQHLLTLSRAVSFTRLNGVKPRSRIVGRSFLSNSLSAHRGIGDDGTGRDELVAVTEASQGLSRDGRQHTAATTAKYVPISA